MTAKTPPQVFIGGSDRTPEMFCMSQSEMVPIFSFRKRMPYLPLKTYEDMT